MRMFENRFLPIAAMLVNNHSLSVDIINKPKFVDSIKNLEELVLDRRFDAIATEVFSRKNYQSMAEKIRSIDTLYEIFLETKAVLDLLENKQELKNNFHLMRDYQTAKMEGEMGSFDRHSKVAFVGSGPFPSTAIAYHRTFGCQITGVDYNPEAVMLADKMLNRLGLEGSIWSVSCAGEDFDYSGFSHVVLAGIAEPKEEILEQIYQTTNSNIRVVSRTTDGLRQFFYKPVKETGNFIQVDKVVDENNIFYSILLVPKN
ncbi:hypothetical protein A3D86_01940 [Candidatus Beckwithbacteria bacterium RIFCSPHIGHO2_02_FULL_49_13]|nr:MAG: Nicotianamine synthase [Candidatus Beckwithbacteria bacterium GW2011_GWC1_49_16]OGD49978.1 MAG: hypothetical protein A3D86_01940 [Candidatus Beckwithbacteria bacterium RIFCSPHIGHO2_02_FULL_49_13]